MSTPIDCSFIHSLTHYIHSFDGSFCLLSSLFIACPTFLSHKSTVSFPAEEEIDLIPREEKVVEQDEKSVDDDSLYTTTSDDNYNRDNNNNNNDTKTPSLKSSKQRHKTPYHPCKSGLILHNDGALEHVSTQVNTMVGSRGLFVAPFALLSPSSASSMTTATTDSNSPASFLEALRLNTEGANGVPTTTPTFVGFQSPNDEDDDDDADDDDDNEKTALLRRGKKRKSSMSSSAWSTLAHEGSSYDTFVTAFQEQDDNQGDEQGATFTTATPTTKMISTSSMMQAATPITSNVKNTTPSMPKLDVPTESVYVSTTTTTTDDSPVSMLTASTTYLHDGMVEL